MMSVLAEWRQSRAGALDHALAPVLPALIVVLGFACAAGFLRALFIVPLQVSLDPNEGWNAYHAAAAMSGHGLYPGAASFMTNNYPPLSFYLVGLLGNVTGDNIVAGRIISLVSFLCVCIGVALAVRRMSGSWHAADFAALLLAAILLLTSDYVGMNDPELLGHSIQLWALLILLREPREARVVAASAALFVAGGFVKHNLVALPLACFAWLVFFDRRSAIRFGCWLVALVLAGLVAFRLLYGFGLPDHLLSARAWSFAQGAGNFRDWLAIGGVPTCCLVALVFWKRNDAAVALAALYAGIAIVTGALLFAGAGVDVNAMFDADIALALGIGLALGRLAGVRSPLSHIAGRGLALACVLPLALIAASDRDWREPSFWLHPMREDASVAAQDTAFLRTHAGPAICESLAYCYWAGKKPEVDVFNLDQQFETGARNPQPFLRLLAGRHFAAIELDETSPFPFPAAVEAAIARNYRLDRTDDAGALFLPR